MIDKDTRIFVGRKIISGKVIDNLPKAEGNDENERDSRCKFLYRTIFVNSKRINEYGSLSSYLLLDRKTF